MSSQIESMHTQPLSISEAVANCFLTRLLLRFFEHGQVFVCAQKRLGDRQRRHIKQPNQVASFGKLAILVEHA